VKSSFNYAINSGGGGMYLIPDQNAVTLFEETNFKDLYTIMKDTTSSEGGAIYLDNTNTFASKVLFR